ncbi:putative hydrolase Cthe_0111 [Proteiniborus sp. DW1]|uniref:phosphatase n=1 Tax=Proteiniborus sp. DW1 TaxID=1889883 RepID=UPI00092DEF45|nr:phosphatase [Proteiniborus sp. DW1]SCG83878.1 putative hydrolase Cthe_0111 [Proteiniborus sp. DW1]
MKFVIDTHCHTLASGHAYSTVMEIAREANNKGLEIVAITDHGPAMQGAPNIWHILNQKVIPEAIYGVQILRGVEANIMDFDGNLDIIDEHLAKLDIVIASLHEACIESGGEEKNTNAIIKAMENKNVDIIAHPGNPAFPIDYERVVKKAKETGTLIEINNSSFVSSRHGSLNNCIEIARLCKEYEVMITVGSDSHIAFDVGRFDKAIEVLMTIDMPDHLIMNFSSERLVKFLELKGKKRFSSITPIV